MTGDQIAAEALGWVDTPFMWLGRAKGVGCDCKGLVAGVAASCGRPEADSIEALAANYGKVVDARRLKTGLARLFDRARDCAPGDVLLMTLGNKPQHLAIVVAAAGGVPLRLVHCHAGVGSVRSVPAGTMLRDTIDSIWRWRAIGGAA